VKTIIYHSQSRTTPRTASSNIYAMAPNSLQYIKQISINWRK